LVSYHGTYDRHTKAPAPGGLFDEEIFGGNRFGRILLAEPLFHGHAELPVLPPALRPIAFRDGEWVMSDINVPYQQVIIRNQRIVRLREIGAPLPIIAEEKTALAQKVTALAESLPRLFTPDRERAIAEIDESVGAGLELTHPSLQRTVTLLFALGIEVVAKSATL
jgi:DNA-directed RNA polymerase beta' subunit